MSTKVFVTREQVEAATAELAAMRSAGLKYDPLLEKIARARTVRHERRAEQEAEGRIGTSAEVTQYEASPEKHGTVSGNYVFYEPTDFDGGHSVVGVERADDDAKLVRQRQAEAEKEAGLDF